MENVRETNRNDDSFGSILNEREISIEEVQKAVNEMKSGKDPGVD